MTQLIVTLEQEADLNLIKEAIGLFRGVKSVEVLSDNSKETDIKDQDLSDIPEDIRSLIGIGADISEKDIEEDDRLAYILRK